MSQLFSVQDKSSLTPLTTSPTHIFPQKVNSSEYICFIPQLFAYLQRK